MNQTPAPLPREANECKQLAEDTSRPADERLVWALLAVAGELGAVRRDLHRMSRKA
ncbi:hypothetical protein [Streptomyces sp. NRRL F-5135]|uniref:hypothetical protein n=1 Tax=Streptomyces sp. NRRL F-5135 TaxID=1463858 RepID=UPI000A9081A9|nr:hypothetical protein [Streptomyces sp. NRRL F-5135]